MRNSKRLTSSPCSSTARALTGPTASIAARNRSSSWRSHSRSPATSGGALQGHEREAALLELVLPLGPLRREGRRVVLQRAHLFGERRGLTARFLDLRRGAPGPFACGAEPRLDLRRIHLPPDSL